MAPTPSFDLLSRIGQRRAASTRQRLRLKASRNEGLSATVSALALIMRLPMERFLAQKGMRPQRMNPARLGSPAITVRTSWVGAML